jgi:catechol 2,3-dioxygenase-like lactoylglutathione lyase family enzyme
MAVPRLAFPRTATAACLGGILLASACTGPDASPASEEASGASEVRHPERAADILAANAFYYYRDVDAAWAFYRDLLGFETVADYGFAKILRVGPASYLTLVDEARGMHSADEPRSVTLAIVTEEVEGWWAYLREREVPMRAPLGEVEPGRPHDGFVAIDPEGYFLEFERFNPHDENVGLLPLLADVEPLGPVAGTRPAELRVQGTVLWLYYRDLPGMERFWEGLLGVDLLVDQGWAKVYQASRTGFIGLVDGDRGLHQASDEKSVTVSFFTSDVAAWRDRTERQGLEARTPELGQESGRVSTWVAYDPEGYFLEWDTFLPGDENQRLIQLLDAEAGR